MGKDVRAAQRDAAKRKKREKALREERARRVAQTTSATPKNLAGKASELPIVECVISKNWKERGLAHILVARRLAPGRVSAAGYYVDTFCLGLKNTALLASMSDDEYQQNVKPNIFNDPVDFEDCEPALAKAVVEGAIAFAEKYGFRPNKRWPETRRFLEGIEGEVEPVGFGRDGKPCLVLHPGEAAAGAVARLERTAGPGNYSVEESARAE